MINTEKRGSKVVISKMEILTAWRWFDISGEVIGAYADPKNMLRLLKLI